jgi:hypothetical protein
MLAARMLMAASLQRPASYVFDTPALAGVAAADHTWTNVPLSTASADRLIVVTLSANSGASSITGTVGGVALTTVVSEFGGGGSQDAWIGIAAVPTGTTGTVYINHGGSAAAVVSVYSCYNMSATAHDTGTHIADNLSVGSCTISVPKNGVAIGVFGFASSGALTSLTWSGLTEDNETFSGLNYIYGGSASDTIATDDASKNITCTRVGGSGNSWQPMCVASFGAA